MLQLNGFLKGTTRLLHVQCSFITAHQPCPCLFCYWAFPFLWLFAPISGVVIVLCPLISDNEDGSLSTWLDGHRTWVISVQPSRLSQTCSSGGALSQPPAPPPQSTPAHRVLPSSHNHVFSVQFYCSVLAMPLSLCLLSVSFRLPLCLDMLRHLCFTIGLRDP